MNSETSVCDRNSSIIARVGEGQQSSMRIPKFNLEIICTSLHLYCYNQIVLSLIVILLETITNHECVSNNFRADLICDFNLLRLKIQDQFDGNLMHYDFTP